MAKDIVKAGDVTKRVGVEVIRKRRSGELLQEVVCARTFRQGARDEKPTPETKPSDEVTKQAK